MPTMYETQAQKDLETGHKARKYGIPALIATALVAFGLGWFGGQGAEKNNADNIPGGEATDGARGPSAPSDVK